MSKFGAELIDSLKQATAHMRRNKVLGMRISQVKSRKSRKSGAQRVIPGRG